MDPESVLITDIITVYSTTLKVDDKIIDVEITELLSDVHMPDLSDRVIRTSFQKNQKSLENMSLQELDELLEEINDFVEENIDNIIEKAKK